MTSVKHPPQSNLLLVLTLSYSRCLCGCRYALNGREVVAILMQRLVQVDGKVRTDHTYPTGFMDVIDIDKTDEHFRLVYDSKGRFVCHRITKVRRAAGGQSQAQ